MANSPIVPTNWWKENLIAQYSDILAAVDATPANCSTQNDGSLYVDVDATEDAFEDAGAYVLSTTRTKRGWLIVTDAGMEFAKNNHPSSNPAAPKATKTELTPEEIAKRQAKADLRKRLAEIRDQQQEEAAKDDETASDDD